MDIQISSNFERLLFEAYGRDAGAVRAAMASLAQSKSFTLKDRAAWAGSAMNFPLRRSMRPTVAGEMAETWRDTGYVLDPHSAVGTRRLAPCWNANPRSP